MFFNNDKREASSKLKKIKKEYNSLYSILEEESYKLINVRTSAIQKIKEVEKLINTISEIPIELKKEIYTIFNYINISIISNITKTIYSKGIPPYDPNLHKTPIITKEELLPFYGSMTFFIQPIVVKDEVTRINIICSRYQEPLQQIKRYIFRIKNIINEINIISYNISINEFYNFPKNYTTWSINQKNKLIPIINYIKILNKLIKKEI